MTPYIYLIGPVIFIILLALVFSRTSKSVSSYENKHMKLVEKRLECIEFKLDKIHKLLETHTNELEEKKDL